MLAGAAGALAARSPRCSLIARDAQKMREIAPAALHLTARWGDATEFARALAHAQRTHGPVDLTVAWIHSGHEDAWASLLDALPAGATLLEVVGSASLDPSRGDLSHRDAARAAGLTHIRAALGYALRGDGRARWLTHDEISRGVLDVLASGRDGVVGRAAPWPPPF
jgi:hypothetical protein